MTKPLYFWNGTTFEAIGPTVPQSPFAYQTSAPTGPATGDLWIDSDGDVDTYTRQLTRFYFVATAGQTSVSGTDANGLTLAYTAGSEQVYVNGALQVRGVDYIATNGTSITGLSALALNDVVEVFAYVAFNPANTYTKTETDSIAAAAPGLRLVVPTSVSVGSGSGSANTNGFVTFSGASSISLNGVFSSTYDNYRILLNVDSVSTGAQVDMRLRAAGSDNSSSNYAFINQYMRTDNTTYTQQNSNTTTSFRVGYNSGLGIATIDLFNPNKTARTAYLVHYTGADSTHYNAEFNRGQMTVTTAYDGITFTFSSGNMTGTVGVYGYKD